MGHTSQSEKAFKAIDRNQPSIIKEEEELDVDGEELGDDDKNESRSELKKEEGSTSHVHFESTERERNEEEDRQINVRKISTQSNISD